MIKTIKIFQNQCDIEKNIEFKRTIILNHLQGINFY